MMDYAFLSCGFGGGGSGRGVRDAGTEGGFDRRILREARS